MRPNRLPGAMETWPPSWSSSPVRILNRVVLPAPFLPRRPTRSPVSTWKERPSNILLPTSNSFLRLDTEMSIIRLLPLHNVV